MKTTMNHSTLLAWIILSATLTGGCSSFQSPSSEYVKPGQLSVDVSQLPDPNETVKKNDDSTAIRSIVNQMGGGVREESPERLLMQANSYFEQKRYHDSARLYKKYLNTPVAADAQPEQLGTIHYRIGYVANKKTFYKEAQAEYAQALQFAPLNNEYLFAYAKASYDAGDYATADQQFVLLLSRAPGYPEAEHYYGLTLLEGVNRANALQPLTNALGALEANALLSDKYYAVGDLASAAIYERQMIQQAAQQGQPIPTLRHKQKLLESVQNKVYAQSVSQDLSANLSNTFAANPIANTQRANIRAETNIDVPNLAQQDAHANLPLVAMAPVASNPIATSSPNSAIAPELNGTNSEIPSTPVIQPPQPIAPNVSAQQQSDLQFVAPSSAFMTVKPSFSAENAPTSTPSTYASVAPSNDNSLTNVEAPIFANIAPVAAPTGNVASNHPAIQTSIPLSSDVASSSQLNHMTYESTNGNETNDDWDDSAFATSGTDAQLNGFVPTLTTPNTNESSNNSPLGSETFPINTPFEETGTNPRVAPGFSDFTTPANDQSVLNNFSSRESSDKIERVVSNDEFRKNQEKGGNDRRIGYLSSDVVKMLEKRKIIATKLDAQPSSDKTNEAERRLARDTRDVGTEECCDRFSLCAQGEISELDDRISLAVAELPASQEQRIRSTTHVTSPERLSSSANNVGASEDVLELKRKVKTTVNLGPSNPGLCAVSMTTPTRERDFKIFRPGSIAQNEGTEPDQPDEVAVKLAMQRNSAPHFVAKGQIVLQPLPTRGILPLTKEAAFNLYNNLVEQESIESCYLKNSRPTPLNLRTIDQDDAWDNAAFASSGEKASTTTKTKVESYDATNAPGAGFGDYHPPISRVALVPPKSGANYGAEINRQTPQPRERARMTSEEKLQAARNAGAEVVELTPEQYRSAVVRGIGSVPQQ